MLIEIRCKKLRNQVVELHAGLNVVLGDANATNSIGKSTILMVIDFAFGGGDFLKLHTDVFTELGHHDYFFTFQFGGESFRFCRDTGQPDIVYTCDKDFKTESPITLEEYTAFLKRCYQAELPDISFRALVSIYSRIWGKDNINPDHPLHVVSNKSGEDCVNTLIKTFDRYAAIREVSEKLEATDKTLKALNAAKKQKIVPAINKIAYKENQKKIAILEKELADIKTNLARYTTNISEVVNKELLEIREEKDRLLAIRFTVLSRLQRVQDNLNVKRSIKSENFRELAKFFPAINQDRLARVEGFHNGVAQILKLELRSSESELNRQLEGIDKELREIDERMSRVLNPIDAPTIIIDRAVEVAGKIKNVQEENSRYDGEVSLNTDVSELKILLRDEKEKIIAMVEKTINDGMRQIVTERFGPDRKSPYLRLREKTYSFEVEEDTGTGVAYTGLVIFDLTVFLATRLPILIHDTVVFKNISNDSVARLLPVYMSTAKQSFIALDEINKYGDETVKLLQQQMVLQLDDASVLYVKDWRNKLS